MTTSPRQEQSTGTPAVASKKDAEERIRLAAKCSEKYSHAMAELFALKHGDDWRYLPAQKMWRQALEG
jgi:hypothetical protein